MRTHPPRALNRAITASTDAAVNNCLVAGAWNRERLEEKSAGGRESRAADAGEVDRRRRWRSIAVLKRAPRTVPLACTPFMAHQTSSLPGLVYVEVGNGDGDLEKDVRERVPAVGRADGRFAGFALAADTKNGHTAQLYLQAEAKVRIIIGRLRA